MEIGTSGMMEIFRWMNTVVVISCIFAPVAYSSGDTANYARLFHDLKDGLDPDIIPLPQDGTPLKVKIAMELTDIIDVDKENNQVEVVSWWEMSWETQGWWDPAEYGNYTTVRLPASSVWTPDLMIYNSVQKPEILSPEIVALTNSGYVHYVPAIRSRFNCDLSDVDASSGSECTMKVGSWTYDAMLLTLAGQADTIEDNFRQEEYNLNPKYSILKMTSRKNVKTYPCCPEPYEDFSFTMTIRERGRSFFSSMFERR